MVKEHRYVFDVADITKLIYTCPHWIWRFRTP